MQKNSHRRTILSIVAELGGKNEVLSQGIALSNGGGVAVRAGELAF